MADRSSSHQVEYVNYTRLVIEIQVLYMLVIFQVGNRPSSLSVVLESRLGFTKLAIKICPLVRICGAVWVKNRSLMHCVAYILSNHHDQRDVNKF